MSSSSKRSYKKRGSRYVSRKYNTRSNRSKSRKGTAKSKSYTRNRKTSRSSKSKKNPGKSSSRSKSYRNRVTPLRRKQNEWISDKISTLVYEGYPRRQAIAIAINMYNKSHRDQYRSRSR